MDELQRELENSEFDLSTLMHTPIRLPHWRYVLRRFLSDKRLIVQVQRAFEFAESQEVFIASRDDKAFALCEDIQHDAVVLLRWYGYVAAPNEDGNWTWVQL